MEGRYCSACRHALGTTVPFMYLLDSVGRWEIMNFSSAAVEAFLRPAELTRSLSVTPETLLAYSEVSVFWQVVDEYDRRRRSRINGRDLRNSGAPAQLMERCRLAQA